MNQKQRIAYIFRWFLLIVGTLGLAVEFYPNNWHMLNYFTIWSNIIVVMTLAYIVVMMRLNPAQLSSPKLLRWKALVTISITLTFMVFAFLLAPDYEPEAFYTFDNIALHYIVPVGFIVDWLVFDERGHYKSYDPLLWTVLPLVYAAFALIKGYVLEIPIPDEEQSPFPYFFLNVHEYGWNTVLTYIAGLAAFYITLGLIMYSVKMIGTRSEKIPKKSLVAQEETNT